MRNLAILAKWLAAKARVDVEVRPAPTASIREMDDGRKVINIPAHWAFSDDPEIETLLEGVIDHEALGHGRFTDLCAKSEAVRSGALQNAPIASAISNILEDVYIERSAIKVYPGVKGNLEKTVGLLVKRGFFGEVDTIGQSHPAQLMTGALLNVLRQRFVPGQGDVLREHARAAEAAAQKVFGDLWERVMVVASEVEQSTSTKDNIALTKRIVDLIQEAQSQQQDQQQKSGAAKGGGDPSQAGPEQGGPSDPQDQEGEDGQGGCGKGPKAEDEEGDSAQASGDPKDPKDQEDGQEGEGESADGGDTQGDPAGNGDQGGNQGQENPDGQSQPQGGQGGRGHLPSAEMLEELLEALADAMAKTDLGDILSAMIEEVTSDDFCGELEEVSSGQELDGRHVGVAAKVKSSSDDLIDALQAETAVRINVGLEGRRLSGRSLSRVALGDARIFRKKTRGESLSTAVHFLVDLSSSMSDPMESGLKVSRISRRTAAIGLVHGLGDVLDEYDIPFAVDTYSTLFSVYKAYESSWSATRRRGLFPSINGGTRTGAAMQRSMLSLMDRSEERKLLFVVTDGDTGDFDRLVSCYTEAGSLGIEVVSIMLGPVIPMIQQLSDRFGFSAETVENVDNIGEFAVRKVLEAV